MANVKISDLPLIANIPPTSGVFPIVYNNVTYKMDWSQLNNQITASGANPLNITGTGTTNSIPKWTTGGSVIGDSVISDVAGVVTVTGAANFIGGLNMRTNQPKTSTGNVQYALLGRTSDATNYSALQLLQKGGASNSVRNWSLQTIEEGVANAGNIILQPSGGDVKIGDSTTDITSKLTVSGNGSVNTATFMYDGNAGTYFDIDTEAANGSVILSADARSGNYPPMLFKTGGSTRLTISSGGTAAFASPNTTANVAMVTIRSTDSQGADVGGTIGLGGSYGDGLVNYGLIRGAKENSTNNDSNGYMSFTVHSSAGQVERMRISSGGAVRINNSLNIGSADESNYPLQVRTGTDQILRIIDNADGNGLQIAAGTDPNFGAYTKFQLGNGWLRFSSSGNVGINQAPSSTVKCLIKGIGTTASTVALQVNRGDNSDALTVRDDGKLFYVFTSNGTSVNDVTFNPSTSEVYYVSSSRRYKENIKDYNKSTLDNVLKLKVKTFDYINGNGIDQVGLIAEEVNEHIPELVPKMEVEGFDEPQPNSVRYSQLSVFLLKAIQEQQTLINTLTARIDTLENN